MKRFVSFLLIMVMCFMVVGCSSQSNYSNVSDIPAESDQQEFMFTPPEWLVWGMKEGEVRQKLSKINIVEYGDLIYIHQDEDYRRCSVTEFYGFSKDNSLVLLCYSFDDRKYDSYNNEYLEIFLECKEKMTEEFGIPIVNDENWINERYKNDEYMMYKAIEDGDYTSKVIWELNGYYCSIKLDKGVSITYSTNRNEI